MTTSTEERRSGGVATTQVEYQMRFREIIARAGAQPAAEFENRHALRPFLAVSREAGSGGAEVSRRVGARLGWAVLDKELVERLADDLELEPRALKLMDETRSNWFSETLLNLFNSRLVAQQAYVDLLGKVIALAAASESVVIVGRGAHLILPAESGLRVRITAPRRSRIEAISRTEGLDLPTAEKKLDVTDADRAGFIRRNFRSDVTDASLYDLVLNAGTLGADGCVELIIRSLEVRGLI
jgi:cytidylate kinase